MTDDTRFASQADHDERAIQWLFDHARSIKSGQQDLIYHAIALARIGARVKPRPISEADTTLEEQQYYAVVPGQGVFSITWYEGAKKWKTHALSIHEVTHFYDLSALPHQNNRGPK